MIEDAVEQQPHTPLPAGCDQRVEVGVITQPRIYLEVVDRVVAVAAGSEDGAQQQAVAAPGNQVIEPPLQPRQPVHLVLERAKLLLGSEEAEGVDLPPDHVINPRHHRDLLPRGRHRVSPDSHTFSGERQRTIDRAARLPQARSRLPKLQEMINDTAASRPVAHAYEFEPRYSQRRSAPRRLRFTPE